MSRCKLLAAALLGGWLGITGSSGQNATPTPPSTQPTPRAKAHATPANPAADEDAPTSGTGKVLFSRSIDDDNNAAADATAKPAARAGAATASSPTAGLDATPEERNSLTFLAYDLDVRLVPRQESLAARARLTVRNDGDKPLKRIALSSLQA